MKWLELVAKDHKEYVKVVQSFGEYFYAEDIVQEAYLRIYKYCKPENIIQNGEVNKGFMYFVLRNLYLSYLKELEKNPKIPIDEIIYSLYEEDETEKHEAYLRLLNKVSKELNNWEWYDKMLFEIYKNDNKSIRKISKETRISTKSIFQTLKNCKKRLKENLKEDYQDYKNEDYELI
ncbi:MAG: hypothetical protein EBU53_04285 [Proteobacteria bacterium]|jgi:RNA polymerase sigma factor (sigma-70 family)|nr:hypothetical protein [Pseudomonadota bacterium]